MLADSIARARAAHPGLDLEEPRFLAASAVAGTLLHAEDLWLALACADEVPTAWATLEDLHGHTLDAVAERLVDDDTPLDVARSRVRALLREPDATGVRPIAAYVGDVPLATFLHVTAMALAVLAGLRPRRRRVASWWERRGLDLDEVPAAARDAVAEAVRQVARAADPRAEAALGLAAQAGLPLADQDEVLRTQQALGFVPPGAPLPSALAGALLDDVRAAAQRAMAGTRGAPVIDRERARAWLLAYRGTRE